MQQLIQRPAISHVPTFTSLRDVVPLFLEWHKVRGHSPDTVEAYGSHLRVFGRWLTSIGHSGDVPSITPFHIMKYMTFEEPRLKPQSRFSRFVHLKGFFSYCIEWGIIKENPCAKVPIKRPEIEPKGYVTREQFEKAMALCSIGSFLGARRRLLLWIDVTTGMRASELASLDIADIDRASGVVTVRKGKGGKQRFTALHAEAHQALIFYLRYRNDDCPKLFVSAMGRGNRSVSTRGSRAMTGKGLSGDAEKLWKRA